MLGRIEDKNKNFLNQINHSITILTKGIAQLASSEVDRHSKNILENLHQARELSDDSKLTNEYVIIAYQAVPNTSQHYKEAQSALYHFLDSCVLLCTDENEKIALREAKLQCAFNMSETDLFAYTLHEICGFKGNNLLKGDSILSVITKMAEVVRNSAEENRQVESSAHVQREMTIPLGWSLDTAYMIGRHCIDPEQPLAKRFHQLMAFSRTCRFFRVATSQLRQQIKEHHEFNLRVPDRKFRLIIIGNDGVGKYSLWNRYLHKANLLDTPDEHNLDDSGITHLKMSQEKIQLSLCYTDNLAVKSSLRGMHGVVVLYDTTDQASFERIQTYAINIQCNAPDSVSVILVGTKCDLVDRKVVNSDIAKAYADSMGWTFIEVSSKENINVDLAFEMLVSKIIEIEQGIQSTPACLNT